MPTFNPTTFEIWKASDSIASNKIVLDFVEENRNLFVGFLLEKESIYVYERFDTLEKVISFLQEKIKKGFENYLCSLEYTDIFTPENYTEEQRALFEREKHNFSGKYSKEFLDLPKVSIYTLKSFSKLKVV
jgi:hypothetical protein